MDPNLFQAIAFCLFLSSEAIAVLITLLEVTLSVKQAAELSAINVS